MIPGEVLSFVEETPLAELPGVPTVQHTCQGAKFHSPRPMIVHAFPIEDEIVYLCGTCSDNVQVLLTLLKGHNGQIPWPVQRHFGNLARSVAYQVYRHPQEENADA